MRTSAIVVVVVVVVAGVRSDEVARISTYLRASN